MTLAEFLQVKNVSGFEYIQDRAIINVISEDVPYGLDIDTSEITCNTQLQYTSTFKLTDNFLTVDTITLDVNKIKILDEIEF